MWPVAGVTLHGLFLGDKAASDAVLQSSGMLSVPGAVYVYYLEQPYITSVLQFAQESQGMPSPPTHPLPAFSCHQSKIFCHLPCVAWLDEILAFKSTMAVLSLTVAPCNSLSCMDRSNALCCLLCILCTLAVGNTFMFNSSRVFDAMPLGANCIT